MKLKVITYLKEHGIDKTVADFDLIYKDFGHKFLLKYNQITSKFSIPEVRECRGLILEKDTFNVMSLAFVKFFNHQEGHAAKINWDEAAVLSKEDGSMIQFYYDWVLMEWCVGTTGMADGNNTVDTSGFTFKELVFKVLDKYKTNIDNFNKNHIYVFELTSPYNIVVAPHKESNLILLTIRDRESLDEIAYEDMLNIACDLKLYVAKYNMFYAKSFKVLNDTFKNMPFTEEGYVVVDKQFNRVKIKNPAYVAAHFLKGKLANHHIIQIIKTNEVDEYISSFPERKDEILMLQSNFNDMILNLNLCWDAIKEFKPKNISPKEKKKFATKLFEISGKWKLREEGNLTASVFTGLFFNLEKNDNNTIEDYLSKMNNKILYKYLK